jgi:CheY-like chemotaxis protein
VNKGSTFTVRIPLAEVASEKKAHASRPFVELPRGKSGPSILVVDDNEAAAAGIGKLLELHGCGVSFAHTGAEAIEKAGSRPDVIVLDIGLPDQDGHSVARALRANGYAGLLIALSGFSTPDSKKEAVQAGFDHYLVKPAGLAELRAVIPGLG